MPDAAVTNRHLTFIRMLQKGEASANVQATARFLGISPSLVYAYVERKQIPHYRIGRCIRFSLEEVAKWRQQFHVNGGIE